MAGTLKHKSTDVLIIGGGISGLTAAYMLSQQAVSITVLSTGRGASPFVTGFDVPVEEQDSLDCFIKDTVQSGRGQGNQQLVEALCSESYDILPFLKELGFVFDMTGSHYQARQPVGASYPRVIGHGNTSGEIIQDLLVRRLEKTPLVEQCKNLRALRLLKENGRIVGALCYDSSQKAFVACQARATILATGGFCRIYPFSTNTSDIGGEGIAMAYYADVPLTDLEFVQFEPSAAVWPKRIRGEGMITTLFFEGAVMRNAKGERFMLRYGPQAEKVNKDVLGMCIHRELQSGNATPHGGIWFDATGVGEKRLHEAYEYFVKRYDRVGINLAKEPVELAPAAHTSLGGVVIHPDCTTQTPGLLACGEAVGNIHGANRIGGMAGTETMVFGRKAGITALRLLNLAPQATDGAWTELLDEMTGSKNHADALSTERMEAMRLKMQQLLEKNLNLLRDGKDLAETAEQLGEMWDAIRKAGANETAEEQYSRIRLENDMLTAYLLALSALERADSVGCHQRKDAETAPGSRYRTEVTKANGKPVVCRRQLL